MPHCCCALPHWDRHLSMPSGSAICQRECSIADLAMPICIGNWRRRWQVLKAIRSRTFFYSFVACFKAPLAIRYTTNLSMVSIAFRSYRTGESVLSTQLAASYTSGVLDRSDAPTPRVYGTVRCIPNVLTKRNSYRRSLVLILSTKDRHPRLKSLGQCLRCSQNG